MTAVHCHNCLARAINTASLEKEKKKKRDEGKAAARWESFSSEFSKFIHPLHTDPIVSSISKRKYLRSSNKTTCSCSRNAWNNFVEERERKKGEGEEKVTRSEVGR